MFFAHHPPTFVHYPPRTAPAVVADELRALGFSVGHPRSDNINVRHGAGVRTLRSFIGESITLRPGSALVYFGAELPALLLPADDATPAPDITELGPGSVILLKGVTWIRREDAQFTAQDGTVAPLDPADIDRGFVIHRTPAPSLPPVAGNARGVGVTPDTAYLVTRFLSFQGFTCTETDKGISVHDASGGLWNFFAWGDWLLANKGNDLARIDRNTGAAGIKTLRSVA